MNTTKRSLALAVVLVLGINAIDAYAVELLVNPDLETLPVLPGWSLDETVTGMPGADVNSGQIQDFANQPSAMAGQTGLWLRGFAGNSGEVWMGQNAKTNAQLSQTVPGVAGEMYTFTGWSRFESNFSGAVDMLDSGSPTGMMGGDLTSPTETAFELAFLDAGNSVIGAPLTLDVKADRVLKSPIFFAGDNEWYQHSLMGAAPTGTASVRVSASAADMVFNIDPAQSGMFDNFSLKSASAPATEKLTNADLNAPLVTPGWELAAIPEGATTIQFNDQGFANNTSGGNKGVWLRPFVTISGGGGTVTQTVSGVEGGEYTFSAWSKWEPNYSGGISGPTQTMLEMAFLDSSDEVIGTPVTLDLRTEQMNDNTWRQSSLNGVAPAGTAKVRVSGIAADMFNNPGTSQSAMFDDFSLMLAAGGTPGDYNDDGTVDAADYVVWRKNEGTTNMLPNDDGIGGTIGTAHYDLWRTNFGNSAGGGANLLISATVPEPASCWIALAALAGVVFLRSHQKAMA